MTKRLRRNRGCKQANIVTDGLERQAAQDQGCVEAIKYTEISKEPQTIVTRRNQTASAECRRSQVQGGCFLSLDGGSKY